MKRLDIPAGAKGELGYLRDLLARERPLAYGRTIFSAEFVEAAFGPSIALVDQIARLRTDSETAGGMSGDDAVATIASLVDQARRIVGNPGYQDSEVLLPGGIKVHVRPDMPAGHIAAVVDGEVVAAIVPAPCAKCGGGPQWGHRFDCPDCPD